MVILIEAADNAETMNYYQLQTVLLREKCEREREEKWVKYYSSFHQILSVGDGDFSFSLSLALHFGSASNIVASSLDSYVGLSFRDGGSMIQPSVPQPPPVDFKINDYPGHNAGGRCDEPFPLGQCSTFHFRLSPTAKKSCQSRRKRNRGSAYSKPHQLQMTRPVLQRPNSVTQHYENPFVYLNCGPRRREHSRTFEEVRSCNRNFWEY